MFTAFIQIVLRFIGIGCFIFGIFLITEYGTSVLNRIGIDLSNTNIRSLLNLQDLNGNRTGISNQPLWSLLDVPSFLFISLLVLGFALLSLQLDQFYSIFNHLFFRPPGKLQREVVNFITSFRKISDDYYSGGASKLRSSFNAKQMPQVWRLLIDQIELKVPFEDIISVMGNRAAIIRKKYESEIKVLNILSAISPSLGVIGTVLGLIKLLFNLEDFSTIGPNMSLALMTTLYGLFYSVIIFKPISTRLESTKSWEMNSFQYAAFWLRFIQDRRPSFYLAYGTDRIKESKS